MKPAALCRPISASVPSNTAPPQQRRRLLVGVGLRLHLALQILGLAPILLAVRSGGLRSAIVHLLFHLVVLHAFDLLRGEDGILAAAHMTDDPRTLVGGVVEELLVLLKGAVPALGTVQVGPEAGQGIGAGKDEEQVELEVVEADGRQQGDGEVGQAPDDDADGGALRARRRRVDLGRDQPGRHQPADAKHRRREVEDHDAGDAGREERDGQGRAVVRQAAEDRERAERDGEPQRAVEHQSPSPDAVDQHPCARHHDQVENVVAQGDELGGHDPEAQQLEYWQSMVVSSQGMSAD